MKAGDQICFERKCLYFLSAAVHAWVHCQLKTKLFSPNCVSALAMANVKDNLIHLSRCNVLQCIAMQKWVSLALDTGSAATMNTAMHCTVCNAYIRTLHYCNRNCTSCAKEREQLQSWVRPTLPSCLPCTSPPSHIAHCTCWWNNRNVLFMHYALRQIMQMRIWW